MSAAERSELAKAIAQGKVDNASAFAEAFAAKHGLNASTVRSTISRMRREQGLVTAEPVPARLRDVTRIFNASPEDRWAIQVAAAGLVRYEADADFRQAVDEERKELEELRVGLTSVQVIMDRLVERVAAHGRSTRSRKKKPDSR